MESGIPSFIGIGATKSGTSWLFRVLDGHSEVFTPSKEIEFFNNHYDKGWDWYRSLFSENAVNDDHCAFGEFTGSYLYMPEVPQRIMNHLPDVKLLVILRNPANRVYSQFKDNYYTGITKSSTFTQYIKDHPINVDRGFYARHLTHWFSIVKKENVKVFIFEEAIRDHDSFKLELSEFLNIAPDGFDDSLFTKQANASNAPKLRSVYRLGFKVSMFLKRQQLYGLSTFIARVGSRFFSLIGESRKTCPPLQEEDYAYLMNHYKEDIEKLTKLLGRTQLVWE